ncbi:TPA_asm: hypothetical protein G1S86_21245, partial [Salmonella enterica subsp. enterica serovar Typhi str. CT18]|nr:hypothetical protein [Salmonella enterica subsp. enterica serovar Typhi str. CT18]HAD5942230.1 hypothetical protein [Salmonella enterica subsp. enterica serovar Typhi str. CT18]
SQLEDGGEGGIDSLRSPFGQPVRCAPGLSNWLRQLSNPRYVAVYTLSRRAPSATRTPHQIVAPALLERALM